MPTFIFRWISDRQSQVVLFSLNILLNILLLSKMWRPFYVDLKTLFSSLFKLKRIVFPHSTFDYLYITCSCLRWQIKNIITKAAVVFYCAIISSVSPFSGVCEAQQNLSLWLVYHSTPAQRVSVSDRVLLLQTPSGCRIPNLIFTYPVLFAWKHGGTRLCIFSCAAAF